jgi:hypothetical protein
MLRYHGNQQPCARGSADVVCRNASTASAAVTMAAACATPGLTDLISRIADVDTDEVMVAVLEDKLIPRERHHLHPRRSFRRRSSEYHSRLTTESVMTPMSPAVPRRRSSSIAVARQAPDLSRFLMTEQHRPWGHLAPRSASPRGGRHVQPLDNSSYRSRTASMPAVPRHRVS